MNLRGRVAVVTGAGAGLGRSYALELASRGAQVVVNDIGAALDGVGHDDTPAQSVVKEIIERGGEAVADTTSVASPEGGEAIIQHAMDEYGGVDILVNNAGNMRLSSFAKLDVRSIGEVLDVHLGGAFYVTHPAYQVMMKQNRGRIVFTTSGLGIFGIYGADVYAAAKGGIDGLMSALRLECERWGIKVNAVAPMARTRMAGDDLYAELPNEAVGPEHVAPVVTYLSSDECEVNGEIWSVGAGSVARVFTARAPGYYKHPTNEGPLTAIDVASHVREIGDLTGASEPENWLAEWKIVADRYRAS
ncbi:MAG: SDR family NAD(P)-dependent oxidoreductase [Acidimicrobiaceae bacterium]|nr:SDR family NAD(P)-dependent oxidoreductase [Acidimicrobiaceae bacterium]